METVEFGFVNLNPIDDDIEILRLLYKPYQSIAERIISAYPREIPYVLVSYYTDSHGQYVLVNSKKYQITPEAVRRLSQKGYLEEEYLTSDGTNPYELGLSRKGDLAFNNAMQERELVSYYGSTGNHIRWSIYERYVHAFPDEEARERDLPSYLLWVISQIETLDRSSIHSAVHASLLIGWALRVVEKDLHLWGYEKSQEFLHEDIVASRHIPLSKLK